jgi:BRO family, N-terminal domain
MGQKTAIKLFEEKQVRSAWNETDEKWYFSIVDIVAVLTNQPHHQGARNYWKVLKSHLVKEGNETVTNCNRLKLVAEDGKMRFTDVADTEQLFRLIQSIPSPKAEPFKLWIAKVARGRIDEIEDPEIGIERLMETYLKKDYSKDWVNSDCEFGLLSIGRFQLKRLFTGSYELPSALADGCLEKRLGFSQT